MDGDAISFGPFRLIAAQRLLLEGDNPVRLGGRAFDILAALVKRAGEVVGKEELIARAWPNTFVEESNLKIQMCALRRALGDGRDGRRYVATVPGRGYNFVAPVRLEEATGPASPTTIAPAGAHNLPLAVTRMIGRDEAVTALLSRLSRERLVTIVGPGGVGKTTLALAVAERSIAAYEHGVWLVDLAPLADPRLAPSAVATVLGAEVRAEDPLPDLVAAIRDKRMLLLLDTCEHVIDAAASLAAALLSAAPNIAVLATSREPLRVAGETEFRLGPLSGPQPSTTLTAAEAAAFPAVQLFVERVTTTVEEFALTDGNAPLVVEICRRLDGLPLAIEFAAPRVEALGIEGLAARLDHNLPLSGTRRATMGRHRTMRAVVGWSYGLLNEDQQLFFRALGVCAGGLTVDAASAVTRDAAKARIEAIDRLADLVDKSLVVADVSGAEPRFRLLDTTRAFAIEMLDASGERGRIARRHAEYYRRLFERADGESTARPPSEWLADYVQEIDNLRAALDWAFSPGGDGSIGVALTAAAVPLWMRLSLLDECRSRVEQALSALDAGASRDQRPEMKLRVALATSTLYTRGRAHELGAVWTGALKIAEDLGDRDYQLRSLRGLHTFYSSSDFRKSLEIARTFRLLADQQPDKNVRLIGDGLVGVSEHILGDQTSARAHIERMLANFSAPDRRSHSYASQFQFNEPRMILARILWLQGFPDQAMRTAEDAVRESLEADHAISTCNVLAHAACPIALWTGDFALADRHVKILLDYATRYTLPLWRELARMFEALLAVSRGDVVGGLRLLRAGFDELGESLPAYDHVKFLSDIADAFGRAGQIADGLTVVEQAIERCEQTNERWLFAELLRLKGDLMLRAESAPAKAEDGFRAALDLARRQGALSWELRAATSLAHLLRSQGRRADAAACLEPVYNRFTEGFGTADLVAARQLLDELLGAKAR